MIVPSYPPSADVGRYGLVDFANLVKSLVGLEAPYHRGTNGTVSGDRVVTVGPSALDASVNAGAKLLTVGTGVGVTFTEKVWFDKAGDLRSAGTGLGTFRGASASSGFVSVDDSAGIALRYGNLQVFHTGSAWSVFDHSVFGTLFKVASAGDLAIKGTDAVALGVVGNDTRNRPSGINTIASGATSVTITNSLVPDPTVAKVRLNLSWRGDHGAARWWWTQTTGALTVNLSAAASANTSFDWQIWGLA